MYQMIYFGFLFYVGSWLSKVEIRITLTRIYVLRIIISINNMKCAKQCGKYITMVSLASSVMGNQKQRLIYCKKLLNKLQRKFEYRVLTKGVKMSDFR